MKSIKVLLISFIITFVTLTSICSANATPTVKVQHLNVTTALINTFNNYDIISAAREVRNSLSTGLFISNPALFNKKSVKSTIDIVNKSNDFFTSTMLFNDKLHQLISYFTIPSNDSITKSPVSTTESMKIKKKCTTKINFS
ncbi:MAG: hypothetical protein ACI9U5_000273 [Colwellia sp.]|jgi:hypothetical protein